MSLEQAAHWSAIAQAVIALVAAVFVWHEYRGHQKARRDDLARSLAAVLDTDELIAFAANSLDWGGGLVVAPPGWRDLLEHPAPLYDAAHVEDALQVRLTGSTQSNPLRLLYRHAFVRLFNHLEIVALHVKRDPALLIELEAIADVAHRLCRPHYVQLTRKLPERDLYRTALLGWYPPEVHEFVKQLDQHFPDREG
jgi:hypothetical protein